jgi:hypothetical protein
LGGPLPSGSRDRLGSRSCGAAPAIGLAVAPAAEAKVKGDPIVLGAAMSPTGK